MTRLFTVLPLLGVTRAYRVGLFGTRGSGKTSLLAALATDRRPANPGGYTATRLRTLPGLSAAAWAAADPTALLVYPARAFFAGHWWLDAAVRALEAGEPPSRPRRSSRPFPGLPGDSPGRGSGRPSRCRVRRREPGPGPGGE